MRKKVLKMDSGICSTLDLIPLNYTLNMVKTAHFTTIFFFNSKEVILYTTLGKPKSEQPRQVKNNMQPTIPPSAKGECSSGVAFPIILSTFLCQESPCHNTSFLSSTDTNSAQIRRFHKQTSKAQNQTLGWKLRRQHRETGQCVRPGQGPHIGQVKLLHELPAHSCSAPCDYRQTPVRGDQEQMGIQQTQEVLLLPTLGPALSAYRALRFPPVKMQKTPKPQILADFVIHD